MGGRAGKPARRGDYITYDNLATFDVRQTDYAIENIKKHAKDAKPFFMDVNFMKMHNPANAAPKFAGSHAWAITRIRYWNLTTISAGSWMPFVRKRSS
jgi:hypothetical protein